MGHVGLAEQADVFEADEVEGCMHARAIIDTEECVGVGTFLPSLDLNEDRVFKTALLCLLFIKLNPFVDIATAVHILKFDAPRHLKLILEVFRQSSQQILHLLIEI